MVDGERGDTTTVSADDINVLNIFPEIKTRPIIYRQLTVAAVTIGLRAAYMSI
jgi:hypothetical protein